VISYVSERLEIASEMVDHILAAFDTGSIVLLTWQMSKPENTHWQAKLRNEVSPIDSLDSRTLDRLTILHPISMETLRLHAPVGGNQVRVSPSFQPTALHHPSQSPLTIPPNTRIHVQAWSLHRNPAVFPDPDTWNPDRWLSSSSQQLLEMNRWFWAFGSGPRMCAGNNLAMIELKAATAGIRGRLETELVDDGPGRGMVQNMGFIGGPLGHDWEYLKIKLRRVGETSRPLEGGGGDLFPS
jgi:cytochrome P450